MNSEFWQSLDLFGSDLTKLSATFKLFLYYRIQTCKFLRIQFYRLLQIQDFSISNALMCLCVLQRKMSPKDGIIKIRYHEIYMKITVKEDHWG